MKKIFVFIYFIIAILTGLFAQTDSTIAYKKTSVMIPMRDGVKLFTVILTPVNAKAPSPFLIQRTPYGTNIPGPADTVLIIPKEFNLYNMAKESYIFIFQDIRGKYKSEGTMQIHQPLIHTMKKGSIDESTDTWDAVDWLVKNV